jgi:Domain of unknown function (DU1801)
MAELKTKKTDASVATFLEKNTTGERRADCEAVLTIMKQVTKSEPRMWGSSIVGFGSYQYKQRSGLSAEWPVVGFSPRKQDLTIYIMPGFATRDSLMKKVGKLKTGVSCLYVKRLADLDLKVLKQLVKDGVAHMKATYPTKF